MLGAFAHRIGHVGAARDQQLGDAVGGFLHLRRHFAAAQIEVEQERLAGRFQRRIDLVGARRDRLGQLARRIDDGVGQFLRTPDHQIDDRERLLGEAFGDAVEALDHHVFDAARDFGEFLADVIGLEVQVRGQAVAGGRDRARGLVARRFEAVEQVAAALAQLRDHVLADLAELSGDVLAALGQRMGDPHRRFVDLLADELADRGQILGQVDLHIVDRRAHLLGLSDQRVALAGEFLQQRADPHFVVAIGALERSDFALHQRFELAGARQRPFDAVAHGRDFAADRLADGDDRIARHAFGFGEPHRDPRHGLRDQAQLLRAPRHMGDAENEDDRQQSAAATEADDQSHRRMAGPER